MPARKLILRLLIGLLVVGIIAAIVYQFCGLIVVQAGVRAPDPAAGHVFAYEVTRRSGNVSTYYVTHASHLTSMISGYIAAICLGPPLAAGVCFVFGNAVRLLIPGRFEGANRELARYRRSVGADGTSEGGLRYVAAWRDLHRRNAFVLCLISLLIIPAVFPLPQQWG